METILVVSDSKSNDKIEYRLCSNAIDISRPECRQALFKSLNSKYHKNFDTVEYRN